MNKKSPIMTPPADAVRLRTLAKRCRDLSEMTAVPDLCRELVSIARELESEAELAQR